jgi:2-polyprenyl-3-methyl-5-hydroxy-6-metoxy-1,4-benzoquinol methylase
LKTIGYNRPVERCYFCLSRDFKPHSRGVYWQTLPLDFVQCRQCGLIFANPIPNFYTVIEGNRAINMIQKTRGTLTQYRGGKEFTLLLKRYKNSGILLDVGCAEGFFLLGVEENSEWKAEGVDILPSAVKFANERLGVKVYEGTLSSLEGVDRYYHFIRMNNVIEHVFNPVAFLQKAYRLLQSSGMVYCSTPNGFQEGHHRRAANQRGLVLNLLENHFFCYLPKTLCEIFKACGFKIVKSYCEDVRHTLNNLGLLPWFRYARQTQHFKLSDFETGNDNRLTITDEEIHRFKSHLSLKTWRLYCRWIQKECLRLKFPPFLPIGHQQHIWAQKI